MRHFTIGRIGLALLATAVVCLGQAAVASAGKPASPGSPPALSWSSSSGSFDYGTVQAGQTPSLTFTLINTGGSATAALTVSLPSPSPFSITSDTCTGTSLGPRKSCTVTVQYTPATSNDSAVLTATSKKTSQSATLTGSKQTETQSQIDCESFGGTFMLVNSADAVWTCTGWTFTGQAGAPDFDAKALTLTNDCTADGGSGTVSNSLGQDGAPPADTVCLP